MRSPGPHVTRIENHRGTAGSVVFTSLFGTNLDGATEISLSGFGAVARMLRPPQTGKIELAIAIAADAAPGPRAILLGFGGRRGASSHRLLPDALFYVLAPSSYAGTSGI